MRRVFLLAALLALCLAAAWPARPVRADDYPYQGRADFTLEGVVNTVDTDRDRVILNGDDGRRYTIDTYRSNILLRDTQRPGETGDLVRGMRVRVNGTLLSRDIIEADRVRVLAYSGRPTVPLGPGDRSGSPYDDRGGSINLRGTVESVDNRRRSFVVRVSSHTRTIYLNDDTDLRGIRPDHDNSVPLRRGDRVTVTGQLHEDGTVLAESVSLGQPGDEPYSDSDYRHDRQLVGRVTSESNRFTSRDIKIRVGQDREVKIHVPGGTPVRRDGRPISVHELTKDDVVRVYGGYEGDDFKATRIDVVQSYSDGD